MRRLDFGSMLTVLVAAVVNRSILLMMNPFGIAYFAGAYMYEGGRGFLILATLIGMATVMPVKVLLKYAGVMLGIVVIERILRKSQKKMPVWSMAVCSGLLVFAAGFAYLAGLNGFEQQAMKQAAMANLMEGIAVFCLVFIMHEAIGVVRKKDADESLTNQQQLSIGILIAIGLYALNGFGIENYSIVEAISFFLLFYIGYRYGCGASAVAGACIGLVLAVMQNDIGMLGYMALIGIVAGAFRERGRLLSAAAVILTVAFMGYIGITYMAQLTTVRGVMAGTIVFLLIPERFIQRVMIAGIQMNNSGILPISGMEIAKKKLKDFSLAFKKLSQTFHESVLPRLELSKEEVEEAFDELTQNVCVGCSRCEFCWEREYNDTYQAANNILDYYSKNGYMERGQVPITFKHRCINIDGFLNETARVVEMAKVNLNWKNRFMESRLAIAGQFEEVADIIEDFSESLDETETEDTSGSEEIKEKLAGKKMQVKDVSVILKSGSGMHVFISAKMKKGRFVTAREICSVLKDVLHRDFVLGKGCRMVVSKEYMTYEFVEDTCYKTIEGAAMCPRASEDVSGDTYTLLHLEGGQVVMSLSDGMGTGRIANKDSAYIIQLMEQLMDTGFGKKAAIRLINSMMFLKSDRQAFSTVDMGMIDLYTGKCEFIKIGAAASYIKRAEGVEEIVSETLPIGAFTEVDYKEIVRQLGPGDMVIMVSDGIVNGGDKSQELCKFIEETDIQSPQEMADAILEYARAEMSGIDDDMTVLVSGIYENIR